jgi:hypothetical protein
MKEEFKKWYEAREGTEYESFAYDVWCAAWEAATRAETCLCQNLILCDLHDKCMKDAK